jgi:uncharacterized protein (DUF1684 family)
VSYGPAAYLDLYDFRRLVLSMYGARNVALERKDDPGEVAGRFRATRDRIFATHPQSALVPEDRERFEGLKYFSYDPRACVPATIDTAIEAERLVIATGGEQEQEMPLSRVGLVRFSYLDQPATLSLYWIDVYGGGLFLPFRDTTAPAETYGGGRYLFDTVKGSDFQILAGEGPGLRIALDFNYAYNPSCAYNPRWACPLSLRENHLPFRVEAGERKYR